MDGLLKRRQLPAELETFGIAERFSTDPFTVANVWPMAMVQQARILMAAEARRDRWDNR